MNCIPWLLCEMEDYENNYWQGKAARFLAAQSERPALRGGDLGIDSAFGDPIRFGDSHQSPAPKLGMY